MPWDPHPAYAHALSSSSAPEVRPPCRSKSSCSCTQSILAEPWPLPAPSLGSPASGLISPEVGWVNLVLAGLGRCAP